MVNNRQSCAVFDLIVEQGTCLLQPFLRSETMKKKTSIPSQFSPNLAEWKAKQGKPDAKSQMLGPDPQWLTAASPGQKTAEEPVVALQSTELETQQTAVFAPHYLTGAKTFTLGSELHPLADGAAPWPVIAPDEPKLEVVAALPSNKPVPTTTEEPTPDFGTTPQNGQQEIGSPEVASVHHQGTDKLAVTEALPAQKTIGGISDYEEVLFAKLQDKRAQQENRQADQQVIEQAELEQSVEDLVRKVRSEIFGQRHS